MQTQAVAQVGRRKQISPASSIPFFLVHLSVLLPFFTGVSWKLVALAIGSYYFRMFWVTVGYHRYFSHRAFKTSRWFQFVLAFMAQTSVQKGALWWAANHRHHHKYSDQDEDVHSPVKDGFWWSHVGWILSKRWENTDYDAIKDMSKFPELVFLNKYPHIPTVAYFAAMTAIWGWQGLLWGGFISTVLLWHGTFTINSLSHVFGSRRYKTTDDSRNNGLLALITCGEGWHNNHHHYQSTANNGFFWWEVDLSYYGLKLLSLFRLVWDLRTPPERVLRPQAAVPVTGAKAPELAPDMPMAATE